MNRVRVLMVAVAAALTVGMSSVPANAANWTLYNNNVGNICASMKSITVYDPDGQSVSVGRCQNTKTWPSWAGHVVQFQIPSGCSAQETRTKAWFKSGIRYQIQSSNNEYVFNVMCTV